MGRCQVIKGIYYLFIYLLILLFQNFNSDEIAWIIKVHGEAIAKGEKAEVTIYVFDSTQQFFTYT
jgi:hypothetical protein